MCVVGVHAQTQAVHAVNVRPNSHAPSKRPAHTCARTRKRTHAHAHARARTRARTHTRMRTLTPRPVVLCSDTRADARGCAWCDYMRQAREKARRRRVEQLAEAETGVRAVEGVLTLLLRAVRKDDAGACRWGSIGMSGDCGASSTASCARASTGNLRRRKRLSRRCPRVGLSI